MGRPNRNILTRAQLLRHLLVVIATGGARVTSRFTQKYRPHSLQVPYTNLTAAGGQNSPSTCVFGPPMFTNIAMESTKVGYITHGMHTTYLSSTAVESFPRLRERIEICICFENNENGMYKKQTYFLVGGLCLPCKMGWRFLLCVEKTIQKTTVQRDTPNPGTAKKKTENMHTQVEPFAGASKRKYEKVEKAPHEQDTGEGNTAMELNRHSKTLRGETVKWGEESEAHPPDES